jgi:hypothetical protein
MHNGSKIGKQSGKKIEKLVITIVNDVGGCCCQGPVCISKYR